MLFVDTSALVKPYLGEPGAEAVRVLLARLEGRIYLSSHVALEAFATFAYKLRDRHFTLGDYRRACREFRADYASAFRILPVDQGIIDTAVQLADRHRRIGVGAVDLLHVATALQLTQTGTGVPTIVCADRAMRNLAAAAGLGVFNPETDDPAALPPLG